VHEHEGRHQHATTTKYAKIVGWFEAGNRIEVGDDMAAAAYRRNSKK